MRLPRSLINARMLRRGCLLAAALLAACGGDDRRSAAPPAPAPASTELDRALGTIAIPALEAHVKYLAADALRGRITASGEYLQAAAYVAGQFEKLGLEPAGTDGWFQQVPLLTRRLEIDSACVTVHRDAGQRDLAWKDDYVMGGDVTRTETFVRGEVVFVGYGIHAPELGYSDYDGVDVDGNIVAMFGGAPAGFPHNERAYYSSSHSKAREMVERGAVGWLGLQTRANQQRLPWERVTQNIGRRPGMSWVDQSGEAANFRPELLGAATLSPTAAAGLFAGTPISFADALDAAAAGEPNSSALGIEVSLARRTRHERTESPNVVAALPGSDPRLRGQYVVFSAHLDHLGTGTAVDGDRIYNGAYDNAMGVSLLIEAARAFAALPTPPERSILFLVVTGEERGLLGSDYFAHHPTVSPAGIIANVNLDMPLFLYPPADLVAFGAEHSSLGGTIAAAIAAEDFVLTPDPLPQEVLFIRSDQYSFVRRGVPSVFLVPGFTSRDPAIDGATAFMEHLREHYHRPSDDLSRPVDWASAERFARANVRIGYAVAREAGVPLWNAGNFFGEKFGARQIAGDH